MGRKSPPPVARPTGGRRIVELGKDLLILLLLCSAAILAWQTPMASRFKGWVAGPEQEEVAPALERSQLLEPYAVAVRNSLGLYGASYDAAGVERAFERLTPFFGEALTAAGGGRTLAEEEWQERLARPGAYCVFQSPLPMELLAGWLSEEGETALAGQAGALLLSWGGQEMELCWRDGEVYYAARTAVAYEGYLEPVLEEFSPNGAAYAGALAGSEEVFGRLESDVLVGMTAPQAAAYTAASPDFLGDSGALEQLLSALAFQSGAAYTDASGGLAINEGGDRLRISPTGTVTFYAGEEERYHVPGSEETVPVLEAALAAGDLLYRVAGPWRGEGEYVLTGAEAVEGGWQLTFHTRLAGVPVITGEEGWCARFVVSGRQIRTFAVQVRGYTAARGNFAVPPERLAAAAMGALPQAGGRLMLAYTDGGGTLSAGWVARD